VPDPILLSVREKFQSDEVPEDAFADADSALGASLAAGAAASALVVSDLSAALGAGLLVGELDRESVTYQPEPLNTIPVA
jgi:hypothetical protein